MHMIKNGQLRSPGKQAMSAADQLYNLAFDFLRVLPTLLH